MAKVVEDIFGIDKVFSIPHYQRDYAWQASNFEDLWEDLEEAHRNTDGNQGHFLGTIVLAPNPQDSNILDIIDGQQRSTTLFLLRYALYIKAGILDDYKILFLKNNEPTLRVAPNNQDFFRKIIDKIGNKSIKTLGGEAQTQGQRNLFAVAEAITTQLDESIKGQKEAKEYLNTLNKMTMLELKETDSGKAIRLFQAVNDRGVKLSILDKLKSLLILHSNQYCGGALDQEINERFGELFKTIEKISNSDAASSLADKKFKEEAEKRLFYYHALRYPFIHYYEGADEAYLMIKRHIKEILEKEKHTLQEWLDDYSKDLLQFTQTFLNLIEKAKTDVELFKLIFVLKIKPLFYPALVRLEMNKVLDEECLRLIGQAEIVFYTLGSKNDSKAYKLSKSTQTKTDFKEQIKADIPNCAMGDYKTLRGALKGYVKNSFGWDAFHYLFFTYHHDDIDMKFLVDYLKQQGKTFDINKEHIVPQNAIENNSLGQYGLSEVDFENLVNSFGNLLSLEKSLNSKAGDKDLITKQKVYKDSGLPHARKLAYQKDFLSFGKAQIIERNEKILQWLTEDFFKDFI